VYPSYSTSTVALTPGPATEQGTAQTHAAGLSQASLTRGWCGSATSNQHIALAGQSAADTAACWAYSCQVAASASQNDGRERHIRQLGKQQPEEGAVNQ
jgi:hypothetical protein